MELAASSLCFHPFVSLVHCDGNYSCAHSKIQSQQTICNGAYGCHQANITSTGDVHCNGFAGCSYSWLQSAGIVYCGGRDACKWTTIFNANELFSYGSFGAVSSIVMHTPSVYGFGYYSLAFADIDSLNIDIDIRLLGWNAGYFANIICRSGSTCSLFCDS
eukprot:909012_1